MDTDNIVQNQEELFAGLTDSQMDGIIEEEECSQKRKEEVDALKEARKKGKIIGVGSLARKDLSNMADSPSSPERASDRGETTTAKKRKNPKGDEICAKKKKKSQVIVISDDDDDDGHGADTATEEMDGGETTTKGKKATKSPCKGKKKSGGLSLEKARAVAATLMSMGAEKRSSLQTTVKLSELEPGTVLEVSGGSVVETAFGKAFLARASYVDDKGMRHCISFHTNIRHAMPKLADVKEEELKDLTLPPRIMVYLGQQETAKGQNTFNRIESVCSLPGAAMKKLAGDLRKKTLVQLEEFFRVQTLSSFPVGSVLVVTALRPTYVPRCGDGDNASNSIATYECRIGNEEKKGEVFLPGRLAVSMKELLPSVMVYKGQKTSKSGRTFYDCAILDSILGERLLPATAQF